MSTTTMTSTCDMCPHSVELHDRIATRYCAATSAGALPRGCICPTKHQPEPALIVLPAPKVPVPV